MPLTYLEQLRRIRRLYDKLARFKNVDLKNEDFQEVVDEVISFFIQCYHMRDWLLNSGVSQSRIDTFIRSFLTLSLCRDLANKQKHFKVDRSKPLHGFVDFMVEGYHSPISRYYDPITKQQRVGIATYTYGVPLDAIELAEACIEAWEKFIKHSLDAERSKVIQPSTPVK